MQVHVCFWLFVVVVSPETHVCQTRMISLVLFVCFMTDLFRNNLSSIEFICLALHIFVGSCNPQHNTFLYVSSPHNQNSVSIQQILFCGIPVNFSSPRQPLFCFLISQICLFWMLHINGIMQHAAFWGQFLSLHDIMFQYIQVLIHSITEKHFLIWLHHILLFIS